MKRLLWSVTGEERSRYDLDRPLSLGTDEDDRIMPRAERQPGGVVVMPVEPRRQVVAVALVPEQAAEQVACNGIRLAPGLHELRHADRLEVGREIFWISTEFSAEEADYDPAKHPPDAFCFLTKARLSEGDPITICPGTPDTACGMIYKRAAWAMAQQSAAAFGCPNCGFTPARAAWMPPARRCAGSWDQLFELATSRRKQKP